MSTPLIRRSKYALAMSALATVVLVFEACKHEPLIAPVEVGGGVTGGGNEWVPPPDTGYVVTCDPDTVYFEQAVLPLMVNYCATSGCHDAITHRDGVRLYNYTYIRQRVVPFSPNSGSIMQSINASGNSHMPPNNHPQMTAQQIAMITTWISQGALNNSCVPTTCDTSNVTFSGTIAPMLNTFCTGCHGGSNPDGGVDLTSYAHVMPFVTEGTLVGSIQHLGGYNAMPPVGGGLSDCRIQQVLIWVAQGAPNN